MRNVLETKFFSCEVSRSSKTIMFHLCSPLDWGLTPFIISTSPRLVQPKKSTVTAFSKWTEKSLLHDSCTPYSPVTHMKNELWVCDLIMSVLGFVEPSFIWFGLMTRPYSNNVAWFLMRDLLRLSPWSGGLSQ